MAQGFVTVHSFSATLGSSSTNNDGSNPDASLIISSNTLYGSTYHGGTAGEGSIFRLNVTGTEFTNLHSFTAVNANTHTNIDGANPDATLALSSNLLYGTASTGGSNATGTIFSITTDGTVFKVLHSFGVTTAGTNTDGAQPLAGLLLANNVLYGTTQAGGKFGSGSLFKLNPDGTAFTNLHSFSATSPSPPYTNSDGLGPISPLVLLSNVLYGTTYSGGATGKGAIFAININGGGFTNLYNFSPTTGGGGTNLDGAFLNAGLMVLSNELYGSAYTGGTFGDGTIFKIKIDGTGFTNLHNFNYTNGEFPNGELILSGDTLYGTTALGGTNANGAVFAIKTDGAGFTNLHDFSLTVLSGSYITNSDGANIGSGLAIFNNTLYGAAFAGGNFGEGALFSLFISTELTVNLLGNKVVLAWPASAAGFTLQGTTNLGSSKIWTNVLPLPAIVNGLNTVTNSIAGSQMFYRLIE